MQDAAHIAQGASGEHVSKIQLALNLIDHANLKTDGIYGPATAAAVLKYKQARGIINRSYQQAADNIVGKMTIDRLDKDLLLLEKNEEARTPHCSFPPETVEAPRSSFAFAAAPAVRRPLCRS